MKSRLWVSKILQSTRRLGAEPGVWPTLWWELIAYSCRHQRPLGTENYVKDYSCPYWATQVIITTAVIVTVTTTANTYVPLKCAKLSSKHTFNLQANLMT